MLLRVLPLLIALALSLAPKSQAAVFIASPPASSPLAATPENACTAFLEDGSEARIGLLCHNDPVNHTDPTGLAIDTIADIGFIGYDIYKLATDSSNRGENWRALGLDVAAAAIPFATGAGAAYRGVKAAERAAEASSAMSRLNLSKQLASQQGVGQIMAGKGQAIAGAGTKTALRDAGRLAEQYGGKAGDWAKVSSTNFRAADGTPISTHAYQNTATGQIVEMKTKIMDEIPKARGR